MLTEYEIRNQICEIGRRIYSNGFVAANDGNLSVKMNDNEIITTPTGVSKGYMTPDMLCKVKLNGEIISVNGKYKPSSEIKMHLRVYEKRPDVGAVVHAHPPYATSFAIAGISLDQPIMAEAVVTLGSVPIAEYGTPSTEQVPDAIEKYLQCFDAMLLQNHGALTYGEDLMSAYFKMESLEFYAKLTYLTTQLGGAKLLNETQVGDLYALRRKMDIKGRHPADL